MKKLFLKKGFTLAEVLIVLTVIGVITAMILPTAFQSTPDENVIKFQKANSLLYQVVNDLVTSGKYYCNGDLGLKTPDCTLVSAKDYFCKTFADSMSTKSVNCRTTDAGNVTFILLTNELTSAYTGQTAPLKLNVTEETINASKKSMDTVCNSAKGGLEVGDEIITTEGVVFYESRPSAFGYAGLAGNTRTLSPPDQMPANIGNQQGMDIVYKIICIDVDGRNKGEPPFGYGIRADGKIMPGARADEWVNKTIKKQ